MDNAMNMTRSLPFFYSIVRYAVVAILCAGLTITAEAQSPWPNWRGPNGNGTSDNGKYPTAWSEITGIEWKLPLAGRGASTPIVLGDKVFVTLGHDGVNSLLCVGSDGKIVWEKNFER
jgi:outer membrane protein assembly factor BamB